MAVVALPDAADLRDGVTDLAPVLSVAGFEGPLDWLVEMARARKIDLARLSIVALVQAFCDAMEADLRPAPDGATRSPDLARWADWLVLAATLAQLRSRLLLPADAAEGVAARAEAEALRRQLVERARTAAAADWLDRQPQLGRDVFARGTPEPERRPGRVADTTDLLRACLVALRVPGEQAAAYRPRPAPFWRVSEAIGRIEAMVQEQPVRLAAFLPRIDPKAPGGELRYRAALASTVVAALELTREGVVGMAQQGSWAPILVARSKP